MLYLALRWRGYRPLLCLLIYELILLNIRADTKPQNIVNYTANLPLRVITNSSNAILAAPTRDYNSYTQQVVGNSVNVTRVVKANEMLHFYEELSDEVVENIPLNLSLFSFPPKWSDNDFVIPRYMMEYFAQNDLHSRKLPDGATTARSFLVTAIETKHSLQGGEKEEESGRGGREDVGFREEGNQQQEIYLEREKYMANGVPLQQGGKKSALPEPDQNVTVSVARTETSIETNINVISDFGGRNSEWESTGADWGSRIDSSPRRRTIVKRESEIRRKKLYTFSFNFKFPQDEILHSAILRVFVRASRQQSDIAGVERRLRISAKAFDEALNGTAEETNRTRIPPLEEDVYVRKSEWREIDVTPLVRRFRRIPKGSQQAISVEICDDFYGVGGRGDLVLETASQSSFRPFLLLFTTHIMSTVGKSQGRDLNERKRRSLSAAELEEEETNSIWDGSSTAILGLPNQAGSERKLSKKARRRRAKNSCQRKPMKIVFKDIGWDSWIIFPPSYEAFQCSGKCFFPLASHLNPTKHAIVQNKVHSMLPDLASRACCVPTKLGPISLLYLEQGQTTYKYEYTDMVVLECGCR